ncbi:6-hydroxytryprostatin B O-methyltransferase protein [Rutstroemia sp. NJR-2017a WRK4]|nr:6-hydroxytryprostatin B O-methyltransferase protein [Rutstroemia sp. NJR-2017a WRK4]
MAPNTRIAELASIIQEHTSKFDAYLASNNLPSPSFDPSHPLRLSLSPDVQASRDAVLEASDELTALMLGPVESLVPPPNSWTSVTALQRFRIAKSFPLNSTSTFNKIAESCSIPESDARSLIRHAMTFYIFHEPSPGVVAYTVSSRALAEIPPVEDFIGFISEEMLPASTRLVDAMIKWPGSQESNETGYALANATDVPMMKYISKDVRRAQQMGRAMGFLKSRQSESVQRVLESFDWGDAAEGLLVDVGGAKGTVAFELLRFLPKIKCIVQDQTELVKDTETPDDLQERLSFMAHDFFQEQPVKGADTYLLSNVLHDWSDKYAAQIIRNLVLALKKGARVLVCDRCLPAPCQLSMYKERKQRLMTVRADDLYMKGIQNAKGRDPSDWEQLFESVDSRFKVVYGGHSRWLGAIND